MRSTTLKKALKNPKLVLQKLLSSSLFNKMDDETYLKLRWKINMGTQLDLSNPVTFNEKIQWLKLNDRKEYYPLLVDKYEAKKWTEKIIGQKYIIPTFGIWNSFDEIRFDELPRQFVLKCTHDSGGLAVCRNKEKFNVGEVEKKIRKSMKRNYFFGGREWPYKNVKPRIIAEKFMSDGRTDTTGLTDFKFFCFNGKPKFIYISQGLECHDTAGISFYDLKGNKLPFKRTDYRPIPGENYILPDNFKEMVSIAEKLAINVNAPFIRVDLYEIKGDIYFSEITFSPCSGFIPFDPVEFDKKLGDLIDLNKNI